PALGESVTVFPGTGMPFTSLSVTVIVAVVVPSAGTVVGAAPTLDWMELAGPRKITVAVCAIVTLLVASLAVNTSLSGEVFLTVNVATPAALLNPGVAP